MKSLVSIQDIKKQGSVFDKRVEETGNKTLRKTKNAKSDNNGSVDLKYSEETEGSITDTLANMTLLYNVPFEYLVPDEGMLPNESLKFFTVDTYWIKSMLDGACSIGRNTKYDYKHDAALVEDMYLNAMKKNMKIRISMAEDNICDHNKGKYESLSEDISDGAVYTGFLLNSSIVSDFNGLEFVGYGDLILRDGKKYVAICEEEKDEMNKDWVELPIARLEKLSHSVMIGIFCGCLKRLYIKQPKEGLVLGAKKEGGMYKKTLRDERIGKLYDKDPQTEADVVVDNKYGVINYSKTVENIKKELKKKEGRDVDITSGDVAFQMIQNAFTAVADDVDSNQYIDV